MVIVFITPMTRYILINLILIQFISQCFSKNLRSKLVLHSMYNDFGNIINRKVSAVIRSQVYRNDFLQYLEVYYAEPYGMLSKIQLWLIELFTCLSKYMNLRRTQFTSFVSQDKVNFNRPLKTSSSNRPKNSIELCILFVRCSFSNFVCIVTVKTTQAHILFNFLIFILS